MSTNPATVDHRATFRDATEAMIHHHTNGLVVVDESKKVVEILSSWDLIQYLVPDYLEQDKHLASFESGDIFIKRIQQVATEPITNFMTKHVHTIKLNHTIMEAAALLSEFHIRQLPVVNQSGVLIGYINRTDIKRAIGEVLGLHE